MRLTRFVVLAVAVLLGTFLNAPVFAQAPSTATLTGTVNDPSGAAIPGSTIVAQSIDSAAKPVEARSDGNGTYTLNLPPGKYRVSAAYTSFAPVEQDILLASGERRTWDIRLSLERLSSSVIVTAQAEPALADTVAAPVDVITREEIDQRGAIWLTPLLATVPGASFSRLGPMGGVTSFFLDGGNSNYTKVLIDGTPVNEPGGSIDFSNFAVDGIDKVEIVHGAASALYGSDAMDGVIQIFTHRGTTQTPVLSLESSGGTFDTALGSGQLSGLLGPLDYSMSAGYFTSAGMGQDNFFRDTTLSGNFGWRFSPTDTIRATVRNSSSDAGQPGQTLLPGEANFGQSTGLHDFSAGLNWNFQTGEHWQYQLTGFESRFQELNVVPPFGSFGSMFNRAGFNGQTSYNFRNGGVTVGYANEVENGPSEGRHNQAGYVEARYLFVGRLAVTAGGRVEANGFFGTRTVPRIGASYALRKGSEFWGATHLHASYGQGIKEPDLLPFDCGPTLKPEQSTTFNAGLDQSLASDRIHLSATYFHNDFRDIVSFAFGGANPNCPAFGGSYFNTDKARAYGTNVTVEAAALRWLQITANYAYDDSRVLQTTNPLMDPALAVGNRLFKRPLNSATLVFNAKIRRMNWNLAGYYVGRRTDSDFDGLGITSNPSYVRWDLSGIVPLRYGLSGTAHFENLFNNHYQDAIGYPALTFNFRLGIKYVWGGK